MDEVQETPSGQLVTIRPTYSKFVEKFKLLCAGSSFQCSLFCGGKDCKYENHSQWDESDKAIPGIFSHWVTDDVLAMSRPSTQLIRDHNLLDHFRRAGITTIINLQLPREHSHCGPGLGKSGFTYEPEDIMKSDIFFYNYGWIDYGVPTMGSLLNMVKVVAFALQSGKVAIHCHAGLGRTGVLIACYLVFGLRLGWEEAILKVRTKRPGSVQSSVQMEMIQQFSDFVVPLRRVFPEPPTNVDTLQTYLHNQSMVLHGPEFKKLKHVPKVLYEVCSLLKAQASSMPHPPPSVEAVTTPTGAHPFLTSFQEGSTEDTRSEAEELVRCLNCTGDWTLLHQRRASLLFALMLAYLAHIKEPLLTSQDVEEIAAKKSLEALCEDKYATIKCILDMLKVVFPGQVIAEQGEMITGRLLHALLQCPGVFTSSCDPHQTTCRVTLTALFISTLC